MRLANFATLYNHQQFYLLLGTADPLEDGYLGRVLAAKESLAGSISASVIPVLSTSAGDDSRRFLQAEAASGRAAARCVQELGRYSSAYGRGSCGQR